MDSWRSEDGLHWYRIFEDGFIEQSGRTGMVGNVAKTISLPIPFSSSSYQVLATPIDDKGLNEMGIVVHPISGAQFEVWFKTYNNGSANRPLAWVAMGF